MKRSLHSESWSKLPWKKFRRDLFRLQNRVWKAQRANDYRKVKNLQKLILRSRCAQFLAIRQVTQLNQGKRTAGIDGKTVLNFSERFALLHELQANVFNWKHKGLRKVPISKKDGTTRILKVPTISDRAWQCLVKYAMQPAHEATFHAKSYGFRPGRGCWDAQQDIHTHLRSTSNGASKVIVELDIEKCFDRINHKDLLSRTICPQSIKLGLLRCLKAGTNPHFPDEGTPQEGVISPMLANISLNGIEEIGTYKDPKGRNKNTCIRYADDMVFVLYPKQNPDEVLGQVQKFLAQRGLRVKESKTHIVPTTIGFDFLGWNFKVAKNGQLRITPAKDSIKSFRQKVRDIIKSSAYGAKAKVTKLAPLVRGWLQYNKYCDMAHLGITLWSLKYLAFKTFRKQKSINRYEAVKLANEAFPKVPSKRGGYTKVKGDCSIFDGNLTYWSKRNSTHYDGRSSRLLRKQDHTCGLCNLKMIDGEKVNLHHIDGNHHNWKTNNLVMVHESCHDYIHIRKRREEVRNNLSDM